MKTMPILAWSQQAWRWAVDAGARLYRSALAADLPPAALPDARAELDGGPPNVLPVTLDLARVRVSVEAPENLSPFGNKVIFFWGRADGPIVGQQEFCEGDPDPWQMTLDLSAYGDGTHALVYRIEHAGGTSDSLPVEVTLDRRAPLLAGAGAPPLDLPAKGVTDTYLKDHDEKLMITLPGWDGIAPGDRIEWYWEPDANLTQPAGDKTLYLPDLTPPIVIEVPGSLIRQRQDGQRWFTYRVQDYAGNTSVQSLALMLAVDTRPVPRVLPALHIEQAVAGGPGRETLDIVKALSGVTVKWPPDAVINPSEALHLFWARPGTPGAYDAPVDNQGVPWEADVPNTRIAAHMGKDIEVYYEVAKGIDHWPSDVLTLSITEMSPAQWPQARYPDALAGQGELRLSDIQGASAAIELPKWLFSAQGQLVTIKVSSLTVLAEHLVTAEEAEDGVATQVAKSYLQTLKVDEQFTTSASASFDGGQTWVAFRPLYLTLRA